MARPDRSRPEKLRPPRRAPDGALWLGGRQSPPPENGARGRSRSAAEFHRDQNRGDRQRPRVAHDAGAPLERGRRVGDSTLRGRDAQAASEGDARLLLGLRDLRGRRPARGGENRLPQSLIFFFSSASRKKNRPKKN